MLRATAEEIGAPVPELQKRVVLPSGRVAYLDLWYPEQGIAVEFDGRVKYEDAAMVADAGPLGPLWHEKLREDEVRALPDTNGFVRVVWREAIGRDLLRAKYRRAGVPCAR